MKRRIFWDYRELNKSSKKDHFPLPFLDQVLDGLAGKSSSLSLMDSVITIKSRLAQRTKIKPPSLVIGVPFLIGSFLLDYVMLLPLFRGQF